MVVCGGMSDDGAAYSGGWCDDWWVAMMVVGMTVVGR